MFKRFFFSIKSWILVSSSFVIAKLFSLFTHSWFNEKSSHPFALAIASSSHHFALSIMWAQSFRNTQDFTFYVLFSGKLFKVKFRDAYSPGASFELYPIHLCLSDSIFVSIYSCIMERDSASFAFIFLRLLRCFSKNILVVPHVTSWLFPCFADLVISSYCRLRGNVRFVDDGTTAYLSSSLPHRFSGCPSKDRIYSLNLSCLNLSTSSGDFFSIENYFNTLYPIRSSMPKSDAITLPRGPFNLIISSKYLSLDLIGNYFKSLQIEAIDVPICYIPHPRAWKNDYDSVANLFPSALFVRPELLEIFLLESINMASRIFVGYSSTAFLLAEMKALGVLKGELILVLSHELANKYGGKKELFEFLSICRSTSSFSEIL